MKKKNPICCFKVVFVYVVLEIESRDFQMLGKLVYHRATSPANAGFCLFLRLFRDRILCYPTGALDPLYS